MQTFAPVEIKYAYSAAHALIGEVAAGELFTVLTADCFTGRYADPSGFTPENAAWVEANLNGVTGPIAVAGAMPGQAVEIAITAVEVTTPGYVVVSRCAAHSPADWWEEEDHVVRLPVTDGTITLADDWTVPARPLIGCLATAPARETVLSRREGDYGGNLDCAEITAGATVTLPVEVAGAGIYFGDGKAAIAAGEVVCAPEVGLRILAAATPIDRPASLTTPRIRTDERLATIVSARSLADACRSAFRALKAWLEDEWRLTSDEAAVVMGIGAHCGVAQVSNPLHTGTCSIARSLLPPGRPNP
jgi:amidase